jgi:hypothetical protein
VAVYYGVAAVVGVFAAVCAALLAGFLVYQCWLIGRGTTTYEYSKIRELAKSGERRQQRGQQDFGWRGRGPYDRGSVAANFYEVLFPEAFLRGAAERQRRREEEWERERDAAAAARQQQQQQQQQRAGGGGNVARLRAVAKRM